MMSEYIFPQVGDRSSPEDWKDAGSKSVADRAHERVLAVLGGHHPAHVPAAADEEIRRRFPIRLPREEVDGTSTRWMRQ
jgi:trimethylamine--corrinoid protein Co-methyltransferase